MGYTTEFKGSFKLNKPLDIETFNFLKGLNETRRVARKADAIYGVDGEFFIEGLHTVGGGTVINGGHPISQPGLWCQWVPTKDGKAIQWDEGEKFYEYIPWIKYIISKVLAPKGYTLTGEVKWRGEEFDDNGTISIVNNVVNGETLSVDNSILKLLPTVAPASEADVAKKVKNAEGKVRKQIAKDIVLVTMMKQTGFTGTLDEYKAQMQFLLGKDE